MQNAGLIFGYARVSTDARLNLDSENPGVIDASCKFRKFRVTWHHSAVPLRFGDADVIPTT